MVAGRRPRPALRTGAAASAESWARRLRRGDPQAVEEVRRRIARILRSGSLPIPQQEWADLEQEIMTEVWQAVNRSRFDLSGGFWGFVELVTSRRSIDWLRARRESVALPVATASPALGPLGAALDRERSDLAGEILSALEPRCRELVIARLRDDRSYRELAEATGKSAGSLRVQLHRCISRAREIWKRIEEAAEAGDGKANTE